MNIPGTVQDIIPRRILVIEDHASTAEVMERLLTRHGHQVWTANSCQEAREICDAQAVDVLLCDLALPDGDGWSLLGELRASHSLKAIVLSGRDRPEDKEKSREVGFDAHLAKPLDVGEIERVLHEIFES